MNPEIRTLINNFIVQFTAVVREQVREEVIAGLGGSASASKALKGLVPNFTAKTRRKGPIQLCPVPKCTERAAPVFGMVCAKHKGIAHRTIQKYRDLRRNADKSNTR